MQVMQECKNRAWYLPHQTSTFLLIVSQINLFIVYDRTILLARRLHSAEHEKHAVMLLLGLRGSIKKSRSRNIYPLSYRLF
mmetsp:Transcript_35758/g.72584  ORF Transcript_35758/g.72584 Transcript_35758/m.72584 type:complete len:81 (-) Transcript_35758:362-604(-)